MTPHNLINFRQLGLGLLFILAITAARVIALAFNQTELFVDEAQYWLWSRDLSWGYFSKPPLIAWIIRLSTEICDGDSTFCIRIAAPILHGFSAIVIGMLAAHIYGQRTAGLVAVGYVTLPLAAIGSVVISTDTVMLPLLALALINYLSVLNKPSRSRALMVGAFVGLAFLAKYAAIYFPICAALAAVFLRTARPTTRHLSLMTLAFLVVISPNIAWNISNGFATFWHTMDNVNWARAPLERMQFNVGGLGEYILGQFGLAGPISFAALLVAILASFRSNGLPDSRLLALFSLPILLFVAAQALLAQANANWPVSAYVGGTVLAFAHLAAHRVWLAATFMINGVICVLLLLAPIWAESLMLPNGDMAFKRVLGQNAISNEVIGAAQHAEVSVIVTDHRAIIANLMYVGRNLPLKFRTSPRAGAGRNHYEKSYALEADVQRPVLYMVIGDNRPNCAEVSKPVHEFSPRVGQLRGQDIALYLIDPECLRK